MEKMEDLRLEDDDDNYNNYDDPNENDEASTSGRVNKKKDNFYNEDVLKTFFKTNFEEKLRESVQIYAELTNQALTAELEEEILVMTCKVNYLDRMIAKYGEIEVETMFERIENNCLEAGTKKPFETVKELTDFIVRMNPIFFGDIEYERPKNSSHLFRRMMQELAEQLKKNTLINEGYLFDLAEKYSATDRKESERFFYRTELLIDIGDIEMLAAHVPWFDYDKQKKELILALNHNEGFALWLPILIPQLEVDANRFDNSRKCTQNVVIVKSGRQGERQKGRVLGVRADVPFNCIIRENKMYCGGLRSCEEGSKTYVAMRGTSKAQDFVHLQGVHSKPSLVGMGWMPKDLDNPTWPKRKQGFKKDAAKIGDNHNKTFSFDQKFRSTPKSSDLTENKARLNIVQKLVSQDFETKRFQFINETIRNATEQQTPVTSDSLYKIYEKWFNEKKKKYEEYKTREEAERTIPKKFYEELDIPENPKVLFTDESQLMEFFKRYKTVYKINKDGTLNLPPEDIRMAVDNIRMMLCKHTEGLNQAQFMEKCKSRVWTNKFIESLINRNILFNFVRSLGFVETIHLDEGDTLFVLKNDSAFYASCQ